MSRRHIEIRVEEHSLRVAADYNEGFIHQLKLEVPREAREWDDMRKVWRVDPRYLRQVEQLARNCYPSAHRIEGEAITDLHTGKSVEQLALFG